MRNMTMKPRLVPIFAVTAALVAVGLLWLGLPSAWVDARGSTTNPSTLDDRSQWELRCIPSMEGGGEGRQVLVEEGDDFTLQAKWHKKSTIQWVVKWDTVEWTATQYADFAPEFSERHSTSKTTMNHTFHTREDDRYEGHEFFWAGFDGAESEFVSTSGTRYCWVIIAEDDPFDVVKAWVRTDPADGEAYRPGEHIDVAFKFNGRARVTGGDNLWIELSLAQGSSSGNRRNAHYLEGSGTDTLVFRYTVQPGDLDLDGISVMDDHTRDTPFHGGGKINGLWTNGRVGIEFNGDFDTIENIAGQLVFGQCRA